MTAKRLSLKDRTDISRQRILDAAVDVFAEYGFHRFRIKEVAARVNLTEAGVLHHYSSKEILLHAVLEYRELNSKQVIAHLEQLSGLEALNAFPEIAQSIVVEPRRLQLYLLLEVEGLTPDSTTRDFFVARNNANRLAVTKYIHEAQATGQFRADVDAEFLAREAVAFMDGIGLQWLTEGQSFDLVAAYRSYFDKFIANLLSK
jgi:AcrR family transcriptional regulator